MATEDTCSHDFIARNARVLAKDEVDAYYSRELITSIQARAVFVAPDLRPLT